MSLSQELRAALRQVARKPLANGAAAATLAMGIGSRSPCSAWSTPWRRLASTRALSQRA